MYKLTFIVFLMGLSTTLLVSQYAIDIESFKNLEVVNESSLNTAYLEFSPFQYKEYVGFVFSNPKSNKDKNINDHFFDLAFTVKDLNGNFSKRASFNKSINSKYHEGPAAYDASRDILYFTRTYYDENIQSKRDTIVRKIYKASAKDDFKNPEELSFCNDRYTSCHPAIYFNGSSMLYAGNDEESLGGMDLYIAEMAGNNWKKYARANMVNTEFNEVFPYVFRDSILIFSSDRPGGLGGLDLYVSIMKDNKFSKPICLPAPINSEYDDLGMIISVQDKTIYFSSNRLGGKGLDDIYSTSFDESMWQFPSTVANSHSVSINVMDKLDLSPIDATKILLTAINNKDIASQITNLQILESEDQNLLFKLKPGDTSKTDTIISNSKGEVVYNFDGESTYIVTVLHPRYESSTQLINGKIDDKVLNLILNPKPEPKQTKLLVTKLEILQSSEVGTSIVFDNIYYDLNSDRLREGATAELDELASAMLSNPNMIVELSSHTDAQGDEKYNRDLSIRRAKSALEYLMKKGVSGQRVKIIGYGESQIRNHCTNGVECNDEEHAYNRRTEVKIIYK